MENEFKISILFTNLLFLNELAKIRIKSHAFQPGQAVHYYAKFNQVN